mmetsp:Transcript_14012/g.22976  ORF Transcript_14012/g.22976 Transcript_14012/m.22976 type:complete len:298 (+) Transcript_14012:785-1678(+)
MVDLDLHAGDDAPARAGAKVRVLTAGLRPRVLRHTVHLHDVNTDRAEVVEGVDSDGGGAGDAEAGALQSNGSLSLGKDQLLGKETKHRVRALRAHLRSFMDLPTQALAPGGDRLLNACDSLALRLHCIGELLPHAGDAEEHRRLGLDEGVLEGAPERVRTGEVDLRGQSEVGQETHRRVDVHHLGGNVRQRQVRHDPQRAGQKLRVMSHVGAGGPDDVVVGDHHGLGVARGSRGVDQGAAVAGLLVGDSRFHGGVRNIRAECHELLPGVHLRLAVTQTVVDAPRDVTIVHDDGDQVG